MYYNNSSASDNQDVANVWSNDYEAVYHFHGDFTDKTSNNNDGTNNGTDSTVGRMGDSRDFEESDNGGEGDTVDVGSFNVIAGGAGNDG